MLVLTLAFVFGLCLGFYGGIAFFKMGIEGIFEKALDKETREKVFEQITKYSL